MNQKAHRHVPKDEFFGLIEEQQLSVTYDEVTLLTGRKTAELMPHQVSIESRFSRNVPLRIPIVSAAMDTVTEAPMAIEIAMLGGLGVIHRNLSPEDQARHVRRVKFAINGVIEQPICVHQERTIESILTMRAKKDFRFHSFPVINSDDRLMGILTKNDFDLCDDVSCVAAEVMTTPVISAPEGTGLEQAFEIMRRHKVKALPIVNNDQHVTRLYVWSDIRRIKSGHSTCNVDARGQLRVGAAVGVGDEALRRVKLLHQKGVDVIVIDTAHADSQPVFETLREIKRSYPELDVVVGNISERESAQRLIDAGADGIKVGQGPGAICTTRVVAGVGRPQVSAVYNCTRAAEGTGVPVCADGGIRHSGHITKALGVGADSVMLGSLLAGTDEAPGDLIRYQGRDWKAFRGMGSLGAMLESSGSRERYLQSGRGEETLVPEGIEGLTPYKGPLAKIITQHIGGLRSGMGYVGAATIAELQHIADFTRETNIGQAESHPHDVVITKEAPNYRRGE